MYKNLSYTSILGCLTVVLGAFGAHKLKEVLTVEALASYETAIRYMFYHVFLLLFVNTTTALSNKEKNILTLMVSIGLALFSGSIFILTLTTISSKMIGIITPIGGTVLIVSWLWLAYIFLKKKSTQNR